jgi:hypothetical protein
LTTTDLPYLRTSERNTFGECIRKWWWAYREGLRPNQVKADALWFGTGIHLALAEYYPAGTKRGLDPVETWMRYVGDTMAWMRDHHNGDPEQPEIVDAKTLGAAMLEGYQKFWGGDEHWDVIAPEYPFHVLIGRPNPMLNYVGTFDGVYRDLVDGKIKLMEHKSRKATIGTRHLRLDNQAGGYWAIATHELRTQGIIGPKEHISGIEYNFLRKAMPDDRPTNAQGLATNKPTSQHYIAAITQHVEQHPWGAPPGGLTGKEKAAELVDIASKLELTVLGDVSKSQPSPLFVRYPLRRTSGERATQLQRIQDEAEHMAAVRRRELPVTKTPGDHCNFCQFVDMCELHEQGNDWQTYRDFAYHREDPYADHREGVTQTSKFFTDRR